jgi:hypothetical protein
MMARGAYGEEPQKVVGGFLEHQRAQVGAAKDDLGRRFAGGEHIVDSPYGAGEMVANRAAGAYSHARQVEGNALRQADDTLARLRGGDPIDAIDAGATVLYPSGVRMSRSSFAIHRGRSGCRRSRPDDGSILDLNRRPASVYRDRSTRRPVLIGLREANAGERHFRADGARERGQFRGRD